MDIRPVIVAYHGDVAGDPHHRYRSWEHCYQFFQRLKPAGIRTRRDDAAMQLGFYLASWGMYRGSSFLLQHAYTVHLSVVDCLVSPSFAPLWETDIGTNVEHASVAPMILAAVEAVREAYAPFGKATNTLVTKVLLGTIGCLPACDRYFIQGFKLAGFKYSWVNRNFVDRVLQFCFDNADNLRTEQSRIKASSGVTYPFMKLVDMYFFQVGYDASFPNAALHAPIAEPKMI
jgi:hypothetical protein